jgi:hypothetical protein
LDELFPWYLEDHEPYERLSWQRTCFTREHQLMGRGHEMFPTDRQETLHHWASPETIYIVYINRIVSLLLSSLLYIYIRKSVRSFWSLSFGPWVSTVGDPAAWFGQDQVGDGHKTAPGHYFGK